MSIKLKYLPQFPGQVIGGPGIAVNDNLVVSIDYNEFPLVVPYLASGTDYVLVFDATKGTFFLAPSASF